MKALNLNKSKRAYWSVTLASREPGEEPVTLMVKTPTKDVYDQLQAIGEDSDATDIYELAAGILSCNRQGIKVTADDLGGTTIEDIGEILQGYIDFITEAMGAQGKN